MGGSHSHELALQDARNGVHDLGRVVDDLATRTAQGLRLTNQRIDDAELYVQQMQLATTRTCILQKKNWTPGNCDWSIVCFPGLHDFHHHDDHHLTPMPVSHHCKSMRSLEGLEGSSSMGMCSLICRDLPCYTSGCIQKLSATCSWKLKMKAEACDD